jgi:hypothetical protein
MSAKRLTLKACLSELVILIGMMACPGRLVAQGLEVNGAWTHVTGDLGMDAFAVGTAWRFARNASIAANYDYTYGTSAIRAFEVTCVGASVSKSHRQKFLVGPRVYFPQKTIDIPGERIERCHVGGLRTAA